MYRPTLEDLRKYLLYDTETGLFTWAENKGSRAKKGNIAGSIEDDGYIVIRFNKKLYKAHILAWYMCFEEWPTLDIDHINRVRHDNRLDNLREVTRAINNTNSLPRNRTGVKGVYSNGSKYMARITVSGKEKYLGTFGSVDSAKQAIVDYKAK